MAPHLLGAKRYRQAINNGKRMGISLIAPKGHRYAPDNLTNHRYGTPSQV